MRRKVLLYVDTHILDATPNIQPCELLPQGFRGRRRKPRVKAIIVPWPLADLGLPMEPRGIIILRDEFASDPYQDVYKKIINYCYTRGYELVCGGYEVLLDGSLFASNLRFETRHLANRV